MAISKCAMKWSRLLESNAKRWKTETNPVGPLRCSSAKEVDTVKYLSEFWDLKGFTRETVLSARSKT
jgi:hypothetical protein